MAWNFSNEDLKVDAKDVEEYKQHHVKSKSAIKGKYDDNFDFGIDEDEMM